MFPYLRARATRRGWWPCVLLSVGLAGSASAQARRYDRLAEQLRRTGPDYSVRTEAQPESGELAHLDRAAFVRAVLARNPTIEAAGQAWRASLAQYPQATALPDPQVRYSFATLAIASSSVPLRQVVGVSQRVPWPGKLSLAGEVALAETEIAREDYDATRQRLGLMGSVLFAEYYAVVRSLELNEEHRRLGLGLEIEHQDAIATPGQRRAELEHTIGRIPGLPQKGAPP